MGQSKQEVLDAGFEKKLVRYQKLSLGLLFPSLISLFASVMSLFSGNSISSLCLGVSLKANTYFLSLTPDWSGKLYVVLFGLAIAAIFSVLTIYSSKGVLWTYILGMSLYAADSFYCCFLFESDALSFSFLLLLHAGFLAVQTFGLITYFQASKALKALSKETLRKKNEELSNKK